MSIAISNIDLCTHNTYKVLLENNGQTNAQNMTAIVNLPVGMSIVNGSVRVKYPLNSSWKSIANPTNTSGTNFILITAPSIYYAFMLY